MCVDFRLKFLSNEHSASYAQDARAEMRVGLHVKCPVLYDFNGRWKVSTKFS
jgi:hypothetical protein